MASSEENQNKTPEKAVTDKVECKSRRSLISITNRLENEISLHLKQTGNSLEENDLLKGKIMQIYKKLLSANITCDGQTVNLEDTEEDTTSEYEPFDSGKEHYIRHTLMGQLVQQMITTARLRKTGATQVHSKLKKLIRPEIKHLCTAEVQTISEDDMAMETNASNSAGNGLLDSVEERLQSTQHQGTVMEQTCVDKLNKAKDLVKAAHQYHKTENSEYQRALCETPPSTLEITNHNCIQMAKIDKVISKKLPI